MTNTTLTAIATATLQHLTDDTLTALRDGHPADYSDVEVIEYAISGLYTDDDIAYMDAEAFGAAVARRLGDDVAIARLNINWTTGEVSIDTYTGSGDWIECLHHTTATVDRSDSIGTMERLGDWIADLGYRPVQDSESDETRDISSFMLTREVR